MKRRFAVVILSLVCSIQSIFSQTPTMIWQKHLGGNNGDYAWSIEPTTDGGLIVAGYTEGQDNADVMGYHGNLSVGDIWITKTDATGNIQWQKCLGGNSFETGAVIHQTSDGGYIVAGTSASVDCNITGNKGGADYWVVKLNSKGDITWQKLYGGSNNDYAYALSLSADGGYIVAGFTESNDGDVTVNHGYRDYWVIKIDGSGNLIWQKSLGGSGWEEAYSAQATPDGGCIVAGVTESTDGDVTGYHGNRDYWVVKLDNNGNIQWQKSLGGSTGDIARSVQLTNDGGYIIAGQAGSNNGDVSGNHTGLAPGFTDYWVVKLNNAGSIQWQKCYGGDLNEIAYYIQPTSDGGYLVTGSAESSNGDLQCNSGITDTWTIKIDGNGNLLWQKSLGGSYYDEGHCVKELSDGSTVIAGSTCSKDISGYHLPTTLGTCDDFWIIKLSAPSASVPAPVVKIDPASAIVCSGAVELRATATYAGLNPTFQWTRNGLHVGSNSPILPAVGLVSNEVIKCTVVAGGPCETSSAQASDVVTITVNNNATQPQISITADNTFVCNCTSITFKATVTNPGGAPFYRWMVNGKGTDNTATTFVSNTLVAGDVVTCIYSDNTSCVTGAFVQSNSIQIGSGTPATPSVSITSSLDTICTGTLVTFNANPVNGGTNPTYQWKINGSNVGTSNPVFTSTSLNDKDQVTCLISTDPLFPCAQMGNANSNTILMNVVGKGNPSVAINAVSNPICIGTLAQFNAATTYAGTNPTYQWKVNGVNAGTNSKIFMSSTLVNADVVSCVITADPTFTCALSTTANSNDIAVTVINQLAPSATITASAPEACAGTLITINADVQNAGATPSYQWTLNNVPVGNNSPSFSSNDFSNNDVLYCSVTPSNGACSSAAVPSNTVVMTIYDLPKINIDPIDTIILVGHAVQLTATVTGNVSSYTWSPADKLTDANTLSPTTIHLTDNTTFQLTAQTDNGCEGSAKAIVEVGRPLLMPNAFTPNGDGVNDVFRISPGVILQLDEFSIFDRWGNKIFTTNKISKGWDGTFNGTEAGVGTYVYYVRGTNEKGTVFVKGTVQLVR